MILRYMMRRHRSICRRFRKLTPFKQTLDIKPSLRDFLCKKWSKVQGLYCQQLRVDRKYKTSQWRKEVMRMMINIGNEFWNERKREKSIYYCNTRLNIDTCSLNKLRMPAVRPAAF